MDAQRWAQLRTIFEEIVDLPTAERAPRLDALGEEDRDMRVALESLLRADSAADARLERVEAPLVSCAVEPRARSDEYRVPDLFGLTGRTIAHFQVFEPIGAGGMGVVYRGEDMRLARSVALKFLLPQHSFDVSARHRFLREARAAAALDHRNICTIYDVGESQDGWSFLAMPLYPGETLKARLTREVQLDVVEAAEIARQIADGLASAHAAGVVHRDLKPGNVMLLPDGTVKILDFGLAKARDQSITNTWERLGTLAYMAPEQAAGDPRADHRVDLYALGVLTYEMLVGAPPFGARITTDALTTRATENPEPVTQRRTDVPPILGALVMRLLATRPSDRPSSAEQVEQILRCAIPLPVPSDTMRPNDSQPTAHSGRAAAVASTISAVELGLSDDPRAGEGPRAATLADPPALLDSPTELAGEVAEGKPSTIEVHTSRRPLFRRWRKAAVAVFALLAGGAALAAWRMISQPNGVDSVSFDIEAPVFNGLREHIGDLAISPDGKTIGLVGRSDSTSQVYVRTLGDVEARAIPGSKGAGQIAFSPNGKWLSVITFDGTLLKAAVDGGSTETIGVGAFYWAGAVWENDRDLLIGDSPAADRGIARLSIEGGGPHRVTTPSAAEHARPVLSRDGNTLLFEDWGRGDVEDDFLAIGSPKTGAYAKTALLATQPIAAVDNTILYLTPAGAIMAVPFDPRSRRVTGEPVRLLDSVTITRFPDVPAVALSRSGTLAYKRGEVKQRITVTEIGSGAPPLYGEEHEFGPGRPTLSPDGSRVAAEVITRRLDTVTTDIWTFDLRTGTSGRLTTMGRASAPEWTPDGRYVVFIVKGAGMSMIARQAADGSEPGEKLLLLRGDVFSASPTPDGRGLVYCASADPALEFFYLSFNEPRRPEKLAWSFPFTLDCGARVSPDGRWMAFVATDGQNPNVYIRPMHGAGRLQISPAGGDFPVWSRDGGRLYYRRIDSGPGALFSGITSRSLFVADLSIENHEIRVLKRERLLTLGEGGVYDVTADGRHVLMLQQTSTPHVVVITNWLHQIRARLPRSKR